MFHKAYFSHELISSSPARRATENPSSSASLGKATRSSLAAWSMWHEIRTSCEAFISS